MVVQPMLDDKVILHSNFTHFKNLIHETRYHGNRYCFVYKVFEYLPRCTSHAVGVRSLKMLHAKTRQKIYGFKLTRINKKVISSTSIICTAYYFK